MLVLLKKKKNENLYLKEYFFSTQLILSKNNNNIHTSRIFYKDQNTTKLIFITIKLKVVSFREYL